MTPRSMALAYRIWCFAEPRGWDCSVVEIAEALGVTDHRVRAVSQWRGWLGRLRKDSADYYEVIGPRVAHRTVRSDLSDIIPEWGA